MGAPDWKKPIALCVGVLQGSTLPLFPASSQSGWGQGGEQGQVTAGITLVMRHLGAEGLLTLALALGRELVICKLLGKSLLH